MTTEQAAPYSAEIEPVVRFHGHWCPGIAIGIRASQVALREIGPHSRDAEVVAIVETGMCPVDAIQYMLGCTVGKGNYFHLDYGKMAFTFLRRADGRAIRIVAMPGILGRDPEREALLATMDAGEGTLEDRRRFQSSQMERAAAIMVAAEDELFSVKEVDPVIPFHARIRNSIECELCGESAAESRIRHIHGKTVCIPCFDQLDRQLLRIASGRG
jgi:formylmethanofuran dehydrogenase subunit E